jgi:hypothetical protein
MIQLSLPENGLLGKNDLLSLFDCLLFVYYFRANGLYGEMILQLITTKPELILKDDPSVIAFAQSLVKPTVSLVSQQETLIR